KQNQGEEGIDCGGPCPTQCPVEKPKTNNRLTYYFLIPVILLVAVLIIVYYRYRRLRKERGSY
ncbi:MAG: hypothetical protein AABY10_05120, partial [Nanoarchaeota archaeon]